MTVSQTTSSGSYQVGITFGGNSSIKINDQSIEQTLGNKVGKNEIFRTIYPVDSIIITNYPENPQLGSETITWKQIGTQQMGTETLYFWKRVDD